MAALISLAIVALLVALSPAILLVTFILDVTKGLSSIDRGIKKQNKEAEKEQEYLKSICQNINKRHESLYFDNRSIHLHEHRGSNQKENKSKIRIK